MFSRTTIIKLVNAYNFQTHADVEKFALEFALENEITGSYIKEKEAAIMRYLIQNPDSIAPSGTPLVQAILEHLVSRFIGFSDPSEWFPELVNSLDHDGYILDQKGLRRKLPDQLPIASQENELIEILERYEFIVAKGHYEQSVAAHARGDWAAANAQLRSFVEELFDRIAEEIVPGSYNSSHERRVALAKAGFLKPDLNEWNDDGRGFFQGLWRRLHPQGSHPGLSEKDDCTFRLHMVIVTMHYIARRFAIYASCVL
ncbi:hypothetical protein KKI24_31175 [bacterium]|nr:hypothetical protein [bacterium]